MAISSSKSCIVAFLANIKEEKDLLCPSGDKGVEIRVLLDEEVDVETLIMKKQNFNRLDRGVCKSKEVKECCCVLSRLRRNLKIKNNCFKK